MGMFDYVRSEVPLPDGFEGQLQTKDFDCAMAEVRIRADGRLLIEDHDWETVPPQERPHPDPSDPLHFIGSMRAVKHRWRDLDFHGEMNFYGYGPDRSWHEYNAKFTDGKLVGIVALPSITSPTPQSTGVE